MLANKNTVKTLVQGMADMRATAWGRAFSARRYWSDKAADDAKRNLAFKFADAAEADTVAQRLQAELAQQGYTNTVRRTTVAHNIMAYRSGAEYVRVQTLA
jgi:hypothetical protein